MIREAINKVVLGRNLSRPEAGEVMSEIMNGEATPAQIASLVTALRMKGETVEEIIGLVQVMRERVVRVVPQADCLVDTCGTGGDGLHTFNVSTTAMFIVAGAGAKVAKHGNRAASSSCGSADVLQALGVTIDLSAEAIAKCIDDVGVGFMFAPNMHPAMKHAVCPRREIGIRTVFNLLGPMSNPAGARRQVIGVFSAEVTETMAQVLRELGTQRAMVFHGEPGMDELSTVGLTKVTELDGEQIKTYWLDSTELGFPRARLCDLQAVDKDVESNAAALMSVLHGEKGPMTDIALLNAGAALLVAGASADLAEGVSRAREAVDSGAGLDALERFRNLTQELSAN